MATTTLHNLHSQPNPVNRNFLPDERKRALERIEGGLLEIEQHCIWPSRRDAKFIAEMVRYILKDLRLLFAQEEDTSIERIPEDGSARS